MNSSAGKPASRRDWQGLAHAAARSGDLTGARAAFLEALRRDRRNPQLHFGHALVLAELGEIEEAAAAFTQALRLAPRHEEAARRLSRLLARFEMSEPAGLDPFGLKAALGHDRVDAQPLVNAALRHLVATQEQLAEGIAGADAGAAAAAARRLVLNRTADVLRSELLHAALHSGVVMDPDLERLLTAVRSVILLDVAPDRFGDRALTSLAVSLMIQCRNNDHAWAETPDETRRLAEIDIAAPALLSGDLEAGRRALLRALYRPAAEVLQSLDPEACHGIRPKPLRDALVAELKRRIEHKRAEASLPRLAPVADETSRRVAGQYEASPYPRWESLHVSPAGAAKASLARYFEPSRLAFMDQPFDVLVAGAGTGKQALQSAFAYGPQARLLATDLSAASLGYAAQGASRYGVANVEFLVADILDLDRLDRSFDIIECIGVLHHMADPWAGWRKLLSRLKPGGLTYVGLYSAVSRSNLQRLRAEPGYPGPVCDDAAARAYRARLLARPQGEPGSELRASHDFYTLHGFRDLALHESERHVTLREIGRFLEENGLVFRGFTLDASVLEDFAAASEGHLWPGTLAQWEEFERTRPRTFDGMYRFWCERADGELSRDLT